MQLEVRSLHVYPIKSLSGVSLDEASVESRGLKLDRRWMLVESDGTFITQRDDPSLVRFEVQVTADGLRVTAPTLGEVYVAYSPTGSNLSVRVWQSELEAQIVSKEADEWFAYALSRPCHLVAMPNDALRRINPDFGDAPVSFADGMPILVVSEESLSDLNDRLATPVPPNRFRANIVMRGAIPFAEDHLASITIGGVRLRSTKRCGRCLVTCTDQQTGARGTEPLRTLAEYRLFANNACMGMYYVPESLGEIRVGDICQASELSL